jgi:cytochrome P450
MTYESDRRAGVALFRKILNALSTRSQDPCILFNRGGSECVLLLRTDSIRHCFVKNAPNYVYSEGRQRIMRPIFENSILTEEGELWREIRAASIKTFTQVNIQNASETIAKAIEIELNSVQSGMVAISDLAEKSFLRVISEVMFSGLLNSELDTIHKLTLTINEVYTDELLATKNSNAPNNELSATQIGSEIYRSLLIITSPPQDVNARAHVRQRALTECQAILASMIERRLTVESERYNDLLGHLSGRFRNVQSTYELTDFLASNVLAFIFAGHESTSNAISWTIYHLCLAEEALEKAQREARFLIKESVPFHRWPEFTPHIRSCIMEALRLYPSIPNIARRALSIDQIGDIVINENSDVIISTPLLHRQHCYWPSPNRFLPERFIGTAVKNLPPLAYLPFGIGHHSCLGSNFAFHQAILFLVQFLNKYSFKYADIHPPVPLMGISTSANNGVPLIVERNGS